jgi:hypothetical protein
MKKKPTDADEVRKWVRNNECAYSMLYFLIGPDYHSFIADLDTGAKAWTILTYKY